MAFTKHEVNPNADVGGGCIGINGIRGIDCCAPYFVAEGLLNTSGTCPRLVVCSYHLGELNRVASDAQINPAGYGTQDEFEALAARSEELGLDPIESIREAIEDAEEAAREAEDARKRAAESRGPNKPRSKKGDVSL